MSSKWPARLFSYHPRTPLAPASLPAPADSSADTPVDLPADSSADIPADVVDAPDDALDTLAPAALAPVAGDTALFASTDETVLAVPIEDEAALVARARTDPDAFGQLYESYVDRVYSYIYHRVGNVQDAEDLTARTFHRALEKLDSYEDRGLPFSAWLFRIAHNLVANWHRDHSRRQVFSLDRLWWRSSDEQPPEQAVEADAERAELWDAINRLPEERRNLLLYKLNTTLSNLEIGELMNKSESAIKSLYFRTLTALRKDLEERGWGGGAPTFPSPASLPGAQTSEANEDV